MKKMLVLFLLLYPGWLMAETVTGKIDEVYLNDNTLVVSGVTYEAKMEATIVIHGRSIVGEESLMPGDEVSLIFTADPAGGKIPILTAIILLQGGKDGLDS